MGKERVGRCGSGLLVTIAMVASLVLVTAVRTSAEASIRATPKAGPLRGPHAAAGPLVVSKANPRYFTVASGHAGRKVVYLTGSHIWNNFHDGLGPDKTVCGTEANDYGAYLRFLNDRGHNFIRLWRWENFVSEAANANFHLCMTPQPWRRTGPGTALDGKPRFDLSRLSQAYFDRLRERVIAAGNQGIYVSVMLFDGFCLIHCASPNNVAGHPFAAGNNINGIGITSVRDYQVLPLDPRIQRFQEAYVRKVVDTVQDLPNVLYEVANESSGDASSPLGDSTQWQYGVINSIKRYERLRRYQRHPVGMTMVFPVPDQRRANDPLFNSPADWVSPSFDDVYFTGRWFTNPPESDGTKVVISDTDHYASGLGEPLWAWKTFLRGHNPILMDFGIIDVVNPLDPSTGVPSFESYEPTRFAMGDTRRVARGMRLADMEPHGDLSSTGYVLADPGSEYLVLQPADSAAAFTVTLATGAYKVTWYGVNSRHTHKAGALRVRRPGPISFTTPFSAAGPAVLHLKEVRR